MAVAYYSRGLTKAERNYSTTELECLVVVCSCETFCLLPGIVQFKVITDYRSLLYLDKMKNTTRWALPLQPFVFSIIHRAGNTDGLSRNLSTAKISKEEEGKNVVNDNV